MPPGRKAAPTGQGAWPGAGFDSDDDDVPFASILEQFGRGDTGPPAAQSSGNRGRLVGADDKRGRVDEPDDQNERTKRGKRGDSLTHNDGEGAYMDVGDEPAGMSFVTRVVPLRSAEAASDAAQEAVLRELANIRSKGVFDPEQVYDWASVRANDGNATIGSAMMILGCKNAEMSEDKWSYKGRMVFQGNRVQRADG